MHTDGARLSSTMSFLQLAPCLSESRAWKRKNKASARKVIITVGDWLGA